MVMLYLQKVSRDLLFLKAFDTFLSKDFLWVEMKATHSLIVQYKTTHENVNHLSKYRGLMPKKKETRKAGNRKIK